MLEIVEPALYGGFQSPVSSERLPVLSAQMRPYVKRYEPWPVIWSPSSDREAARLSQEIENDFGHHRIELLLCDHPERNFNAARAHYLEAMEAMGLTQADPPTKAERIDPWILRDEFLRVQPNASELVRFLNRWGVWTRQYGVPRPGLLGKKNPGDGPVFVFADSIWSDQDAFRTALKSSDATAWLSRFTLGGFEARDAFPHFVQRVSNCRDAIAATITFDFLRGSKFRLCALKDCQVPFRLESDHKRRFCNQYHAHLASVRRNRKRISVKKKNSGRKKTNGNKR